MRKNVPLLHLARTAVGVLAFALGTAGIAGAQMNAPLGSGPMTTEPATTQPAGPPPTYATPIAGETISGHITAVTGKYSLQVRDARGFIDNVMLHQGTIINPRGLTLGAGMQVTINGSNAGSVFTANQIDAPYTVALVPGYGYGAPFYGGSLGFGFGPGWGFGPRFRGGFWW